MSDAIDALPPLREVIAQHELAARKSLGQNFLLDLNLTRKIARAAMPWTDVQSVIEIGPGPGGLTRAILLEGAPKLTAVERDDRCLTALADLVQAADGRLALHPGDALETDFATLAPAPWQVVANLPYNIATPLILNWVAQAEKFTRITVLVQKEVAERLAAKPGGKTYGRLAVAAQWRCNVRMLFDIGPKAFVPPPKVTSTLVELEPRKEPVAPAEAAKLERVTAAAFNQRRKMLRAALKSLWPDADAKLEQAGIDPTRRAETLSIEEFCALARLL